MDISTYTERPGDNWHPKFKPLPHEAPENWNMPLPGVIMQIIVESEDGSTKRTAQIEAPQICSVQDANGWRKPALQPVFSLAQLARRNGWTWNGRSCDGPVDGRYRHLIWFMPDPDRPSRKRNR